MSMPKPAPNKTTPDVINTRKFDEKWVNPETHVGQPSCREEIKKAEKTHAK